MAFIIKKYMDYRAEWVSADAQNMLDLSDTKIPYTTPDSLKINWSNECKLRNVTANVQDR